MASVVPFRVEAKVQKALPLFCWILIAAGGVGRGLGGRVTDPPMAVSRLERGADPVMVRHGLDRVTTDGRVRVPE